MAESSTPTVSKDAFASTVAELFANCSTYDEKVDVLVDLVSELASDAQAKKVAKGRAAQKAADSRRPDEDDPNAGSSAAVGGRDSNNPADF